VLVVVEWTCGGARSWAYCDAAGGALALPGVDWCRIAYYSSMNSLFLGAASAFIDASIIPSVQSGIKARCTSQGANVGPATLPSWQLVGAQPFQKSVHLIASPGVAGEELELLLAQIGGTIEGIGFPQLGGTTIAAINAQEIPVSPDKVVFGGGFTTPPTGQRIVRVQVEVQVC
jgi:hypothetical protein